MAQLFRTPGAATRPAGRHHTTPQGWPWASFAEWIARRSRTGDGGDLYLKPRNSRYPIKPLGSARVIGVVREFSKRFR